MSFEPAGFAREINRAPRQGKQPSFAFTRACHPFARIVVAAGRRTERDKERKTERREGRVSTTTVALQQCGPATRCTEIPIGCQIAIRLVGHCTTTDYRARIEPDRTKSACAFRIFQLSRGAPEAGKFHCLVVDQTTEHSADNCNVAFHRVSPLYFSYACFFSEVMYTSLIDERITIKFEPTRSKVRSVVAQFSQLVKIDSS